MQCEAWTRGQVGDLIDSRYPVSHRCPHTARFRVQSRQPDVVLGGEHVCGVHVRPALMDNGDSVWHPWIITRLAA